MKTRVAAAAILLLAGLSAARAVEPDPYRRAYQALSEIDGISGLGCSTATQVVHEIGVGSLGYDNDAVMRNVMKHRYGLGGLETLRCSFSKLTDAGAREIKGLPKLDSLNLAYNRVTDVGVAAMIDLPKLRSLSLADNPVTGVGLEPARMPNLRGVDLSECPVSDAGLKVVAGHQNLEMLALAKAPITDAGLKHLQRTKNLKSLYLVDMRVTDAGLKELASLPLNELHLNGSKVTGIGLQDFRSLRTLIVFGTPFNDDGLKAIVNNAALRTLDLRRTRITDAGMKHLGQLKALQTLDLGHTRVTGKGLKELSASKTLNRFMLSDDQMTDETFRALLDNGLLHLCSNATASSARPKNAGEITHLIFMRTPITDASLKLVASLGSLRFLNLRGTKVTDEGVAELKKVRPNLRIVR